MEWPSSSRSQDRLRKSYPVVGHQTILSLHGEAFLEPLVRFTSLTPRHEISRVSKDTHPVHSFSSRPRHRAYP
jgi:hypothetical protein